MKSLAELAAIREKMQKNVILREGSGQTRVVEPIVEVFEAGKDKVTYVKMTPEKAKEIVEKHIKGGKIVEEYTIGAAK